MKIFLSKRLQNQQSENCSFVSIFDAHSDHLETEFQMIYSKILITSYQKGQQRSYFRCSGNAQIAS